MLGRWQERWTHWFYRKVPFWTASDCTRGILESHGVRSVKIIRYGVYTVPLPVLDEKILASPLRLVVVSRLAPNKRIDHAVRLMKCLEDRGIDAKLAIVGIGEEDAHLKQLTRELNLDRRITFAGGLPEAEKDARLREAHFLVHNSIREGWGLNVIEANAMGTPGLVYPVAGLIESTLHDQTGIVSENETPESMAAALQAILRQPAAKYAEYRVKAWERSRTLHWDYIIPQACDWLEAQAARKSWGI
jgi:glycosyltransferase involved in cell wall biosynthesis